MNKTATKRADELLTAWEQRLSPNRSRSSVSLAPLEDNQQKGPVKRANGLMSHLGDSVSSQRLMQAAAFGYVALAVKTQEVINPVRQSWQKSVEEAQQKLEQQAAQAGGAPAARREASEANQGEQTLKKDAGTTAEVASTASDAL